MSDTNVCYQSWELAHVSSMADEPAPTHSQHRWAEEGGKASQKKMPAERLLCTKCILVSIYLGQKEICQKKKKNWAVLNRFRIVEISAIPSWIFFFPLHTLSLPHQYQYSVGTQVKHPQLITNLIGNSHKPYQMYYHVITMEEASWRLHSMDLGLEVSSEGWNHILQWSNYNRRLYNEIMHLLVCLI